MKGYTMSEIIGRLLGTLAELWYLRIVAMDGLSQQNSIAIFKGRSYEELEGQQFVVFGTSAGREAGWVCQRLQSLVIRGMWATRSKDQPDAGMDFVTLTAFSEKHHWIAFGTTTFGKHFRTAISNRIKTLPELRELTLGSVTFDYSEIHPQYSASA